MKILLMNDKEIRFIDPQGMMTIGGKESTGLKLNSLQYQDDYAVISYSNEEGLSVIPLKGMSKKKQTLSKNEKTQIKDLIISPVEINHKAQESHGLVEQNVNHLIELISQARTDKDVAGLILNYALEGLEFDRGLVLGLNGQQDFEILSHREANPSAPWLAESFLQEILEEKKPVIVENLIGSHFEKNSSLMGTGFLSVAGFPLIWRGQTVGAFVVGSSLPQKKDKILNHSILSTLILFVAQYVYVWNEQKKIEKKLTDIKRWQQEDQPFVTQNRLMLSLIDYSRKLSSTDLNLYVHGETGVGKEVLARWIHQKSTYTKGPFVAVNCGAIPENLIESTLFGHKKGSFTGAYQDQAGKFLSAHGGTLFLDEIGDLPMSVQTKLLRVLQERVVEPVGSNKPISVHLRVLCASHKDLKQLVADGKFREDLYYRLAEASIEIPNLNSRRDDIEIIALNYLKENYPEKSLAPEALAWLECKDWKGNVRELLSTLKRAALLSPLSEITAFDFQENKLQKTATHWLGADTLEEAVKAFQRQKVLEALKLTQENRTEAAKLLGITPRTLFRYLEDMARHDMPVSQHDKAVILEGRH